MSQLKNICTTDYKTPDKYLPAIYGAGEMVKLETGATLYEMGEFAKDIYFVKSGRVEATCIFENGKSILIDNYGKGSFFGHSETLSGQMRTTNIFAAEKSELIKLSKAKFMDLIFYNRDLGQILVNKVANESRMLTIRLSNSNCLPAKHIVIRDILDRLWNIDKSNKIFPEGERNIFVPTRKLWASYLGLSRETLARILSEIQKNGWIEIVNSNGIIIKNVKALRAFSEHNSGE
jgi:CRP-like cAMP-binding protein